MLSSYAAHDHRLTLKRQRRLDSGSLSPSQELAEQGYMATSRQLKPEGLSAFAERWNECHDVLS
jgi:hypothetical protein